MRHIGVHLIGTTVTMETADLTIHMALTELLTLLLTKTVNTQLSIYMVGNST